MRLLFREDEAVNKISTFYTCANVVTLSSTILVLLYSEWYLLLGCRRICPLFLFLLIFEILKWSVQVIIYRKGHVSLNKQTFYVLYKSVNNADILRSIFISVICCLGYYIIAVLFGAELLSKQEETLMFSMLLTSVTALPISIQLGSENIEHFLQGVIPNNTFHSLLNLNSRGAIVGAWFGAFVIPLDWDRPWQVWPIPCALGGLIGCCLFSWVHLSQMLLLKFGLINRKFILKIKSF